MHRGIPEPSNRISKNFIKAHRLTYMIVSVILVIIYIIIFFFNHYFEWHKWVNWAVGGLTILTVFFTIWEIIAYPYLIHKSWRYEVDEEFVQIKYGIFVVRHQIVPMTKVQSVQLKQGPIMRKYHLYTIEIGTMGTSHKILGLPKAEAIQLRNAIARYAKIKEVEEE